MKYTFTVELSAAKKTVDKEKTFAEIVERCNELNDCDILIVRNFGEKGDLELSILKDSDYNAERDPESYNLVSIVTAQREEDGTIERVDDTEDTYVTDGSLYNELERIWNYRNFKLL